MKSLFPYRGRETLPYVRWYFLPVNRPLLDANLTLNVPVFHFSPHSMTTPFLKFQDDISKFSRASHTFQKFHHFISWELQTFTTIWPNLHRIISCFGNSQFKRLFFIGNSTLNAPCIRSTVGIVTFILECPLPQL